MLRRFYYAITLFTKQIKEKQIGMYASSSAFFIFLSLIPVMLLMCAILPYTNLTRAMFVESLNEIVPSMMESFLTGIVNEVYERSITIVSVSAIAALWSAGKGMMALKTCLNGIQEVDETRNYFFLRISASFYTVVMLVAVIFSIMIVGLGQYLANLIVSYVPQLQFFLEFLMSIRHVFAVLVLEVAFVIIYTWIPNNKVRWKAQIPGALVVGLGWTGFSTVFSIYVGKFGGFSIYGSLATVIALLLWLYICMYIVFIGALMNKNLEPFFAYLARRIRKMRTQQKTK
ncbi:MAG: YihY/virulence factor BrkB family protein [Lachnospiraceae bacterium]|nr:YihY/virulence factor BrkB family protein [Lachnospiraceae bacterium]